MIVNLDYSNLDINWIIADENKVDKEYKQYLLKKDGDVIYPNKPESINLLNENSLIYASSNNGKKHLVTYKIDYSNRSFKQTDDYELNTDKSTYLEVLNKGDYVVTQDHTIFEIENDEEVISMNVNSSLYNTKKMALYANDIYTGVQGIRLGSLGESSKAENFILLGSKVDKNILKKYNISLYKDFYGLKIKGTFKANDDVQIVLDNVLDKKAYNLVNKEDSNEKIKVSRYISEDGIKGKYYIYLRVNGKIYKLQKYVVFY